METVTEALQSAVHFQTHLKGLERAHLLLSMIQQATLRSQRYEADSKINWFTNGRKEKYAHRSEISAMAAARLTKAYKRQLFNLFYKSKL